MKNRISYDIRLAALGLVCSAFVANMSAQQAPPQPGASSTKPAKPTGTPAAKKGKAASTAPAQAAAGTTSATSGNAGDKVVMKVGNQQITQADIDFLVSKLNPEAQKTIAEQGRRSLGENYAMMLLLAERAKSHHAETTPEFRRQVELFELQTLAQSEYQAIAEQAVLTPEEVKQYYAAHNSEFEEVQIRQVVIRKKADNAAADVPGLKAADAKARAEEIRKALAAGGDVSKIIQDFSQPNVVLIEAQPHSVRHAQLLAELDKAAFQLKDGEISEPLETPQALVFLQKVGHDQLELQAATKEIEAKLRQEKVEAALAEMRSKTPVWMDDSYFVPPATAPQAAEPAGNPQQ